MRTAVPIARLTAWLLVPLTLAFAAATAAALVWTKAAAERDLRQRLEGTVEALALAPVDSLASPVPLEALAGRHGYFRVWLVEAGHRIAASNVRTEADAPLDPRWRALLEAAGDGDVVASIAWGTRVLLFVAARSPLGGTWAVVLHDTTAFEAALQRRLVGIGLAGLGLWLLTALAVFLLVRYRFVRPVEAVHDAVAKVVAGEALPEATVRRVHAAAERSVGVLADVMLEQARAQRTYLEHLQEAAAFYLALFDLMPAPAFIGTLDGALVEANRAFCERLGLVRASILGRPLKSFKALLPVDALVALAVRSREENCTFERVDFAYQRPDGVRIPVLVSVQAVPFQGEPAFVVVAEDRTEARELQGKLAAFNDTVELMVDERAATAAAPFVDAVRRLEAPLAALVRLAEFVGGEGEEAGKIRPDDRRLLLKAGRRLRDRFADLARAAAPPPAAAESEAGAGSDAVRAPGAASTEDGEEGEDRGEEARETPGQASARAGEPG